MEDLNPLLDLLPPQVRAWAMAVCAFVGALGLAVLAVKGFILSQLGLPQPNDPKWKVRLFKVCKLLDALGLNTATFSSMLEIARKEGEIRKLHASKYPPPVQPFDHPVSVPPPPDHQEQP